MTIPEIFTKQELKDTYEDHKQKDLIFCIDQLNKEMIEAVKQGRNSIITEIKCVFKENKISILKKLKKNKFTIKPDGMYEKVIFFNIRSTT